MIKRARRLRTSAPLRELVKEHQLLPADLVQPFFVIEGKQKREAIAPMPGISRVTVDLLLKDIEHFVGQGGNAVILFGISSKKDTAGKYAVSAKALIPTAISAIKKRFPNLVVFSDVCLCAYLSHGHCGIIHDGQVDNDKTLPILSQMALVHAEAGVDMVAPSDMMDGRVKSIRDTLDTHGLSNTGIMSYAVKYASAYYGPFRDAADCAPGFGDRKSYQMDPGNSKEALKEAKEDVYEGADIVMVKPALAYMDIIKLLADHVNVPVAAYNVSGEYSMVKAAAIKGLIDERAIVLETLLGFKRAGANIIITYHAKDVLGWPK